VGSQIYANSYTQNTITQILLTSAILLLLILEI